MVVEGGRDSEHDRRASVATLGSPVEEGGLDLRQFLAECSRGVRSERHSQAVCRAFREFDQLHRLDPSSCYCRYFLIKNSVELTSAHSTSSSASFRSPTFAMYFAQVACSSAVGLRARTRSYIADTI